VYFFLLPTPSVFVTKYSVPLCITLSPVYTCGFSALKNDFAGCTEVGCKFAKVDEDGVEDAFAEVDEDGVEDAFAEVDEDEDEDAVEGGGFLVNKVFSASFKSTFLVEDKFEDVVLG
jgi:hypothetical protein